MRYHCTPTERCIHCARAAKGMLPQWGQHLHHLGDEPLMWPLPLAQQPPGCIPGKAATECPKGDSHVHQLGNEQHCSTVVAAEYHHVEMGHCCYTWTSLMAVTLGGADTNKRGVPSVYQPAVGGHSSPFHVTSCVLVDDHILVTASMSYFSHRSLLRSQNR